jgi:hypothetical protein
MILQRSSFGSTADELALVLTVAVEMNLDRSPFISIWI